MGPHGPAAIAAALKAYVTNMDADDYVIENIEIVDGEVLATIDGENYAITVEAI